MTPGESTDTPTLADLNSAADILEHFEQLEAQFEQLRRQLTHSHRLATLGMIASIIAHEYNNILTPMMSYAQLALMHEDDPELMRKALQKTVDGSERAARISASLLGFARDDDDDQPIANLPATIEQSFACLAREPEKDGIELTVDVPEINLAIRPLALQQVLVNLILNARKAMHSEGGRLHVSGELAEGVARIHLADTGPGIPEAIQDRLFEPFVTQPVRSGAGEPKGTGLGLCICRDLIQAAGGELTFDTQQGEGTTFHITLPLAPRPIETT